MSGYLDKHPRPLLAKDLTTEIANWSVFEEDFDVEFAKSWLELSKPTYQERKGGHAGEPITGTRYLEVPGHLFYMAINDSIPLSILKELNGIDERYSGGYGSNDIDLGMRANFIGWKFCNKLDSVNYEIAQDGVPTRTKDRSRTPEDNYRIYREQIAAVQEKRRSPVTQKGYGAWE